MQGLPEKLPDLAQDAARNFEDLPQGVDGLRALKLAVLPATNDTNAALLHAPLIVAEAAANLRAPLSPFDLVRLIALRESNPNWFDAALPCVLSLALSMKD